MKQLLQAFFAMMFLALITLADAHAFEVWSGAFEVRTSEGLYHSFTGTFPMDKAECIKEAVNTTVGNYKAAEFTNDFATIIGVAREYSTEECGWPPSNNKP